MPEFCKVERDGHVTTITINRPEVMNAIHPPASAELSHAFDAFVADPTPGGDPHRRGEKAFSAGNDLKYQAAAQDRMARHRLRGITQRFENAKPVIAAVNGFALGGGFEIVLACDIAIASEKASFRPARAPCRQAAMAGGMHRLPRRSATSPRWGCCSPAAASSRARPLALASSRVVAPHQLMTIARRWADAICECSPVSVRHHQTRGARGLTTRRCERR